MVDAITATTAQTNASARTTLADNFDTFLTLLTAQLENQDPLAPMDSTQFTQQLVQFSQVEQQIKTNEQLESMLAATKAANTGAALSYLGRTAILDSSVTALQDGKATWSYGLNESADSVTIEVRNAQGVTVYSANGDKAQGSHLFEWDGKNNSGVVQPNGAYRLVVTAKNDDGNSISPVISTRETIIGVDLASENPAVLTPSGQYDLSIIRAILDN